jgi:hypothetical protein
MWEWIVIGVLYVLALCFFRLLGGWGAASDALRRWGSSNASVRTSAGSSSS